MLLPNLHNRPDYGASFNAVLWAQETLWPNGRFVFGMRSRARYRIHADARLVIARARMFPLDDELLSKSAMCRVSARAFFAGPHASPSAGGRPTDSAAGQSRARARANHPPGRSRLPSGRKHRNRAQPGRGIGELPPRSGALHQRKKVLGGERRSRRPECKTCREAATCRNPIVGGVRFPSIAVSAGDANWGVTA